MSQIGGDLYYVRVTATAPNLALMFLPAVGTPSTVTIGTYAVAGQVLQSSFSSTSTVGVFPFSPYAHTDGATPAAVLATTRRAISDLRRASSIRWAGRRTECLCR